MPATPVTDDDLARVAASLLEVEDLFTRLDAYSNDATMPCPECGGTGTLAGGGIFGEIMCPTCEGARMVEHPAADHLKQLARPNFTPLHDRLRQMTAAHDQAQRQAYLGEGDGVSPVHRDALLAFERDIAAAREQGREQAVKQIMGGPAPTPGERRAVLPKAKRESFGSLGGGTGDDED